jgi:hypothetical protein
MVINSEDDTPYEPRMGGYALMKGGVASRPPVIDDAGRRIGRVEVMEVCEGDAGMSCS